MKNLILTLKVAVIIVVLTGCSSIPNINQSDDKTEAEWGKTLSTLIPHDPVPEEIKLKSGKFIVADVVKVIDGDTIIIKNMDISYLDKDKKRAIENIKSFNKQSVSVRFLSIDAPEITSGKNEYYGKEAKLEVEKLLYSNEVILEIDPKAKTDGHERLLAHIYTLEGINIQKHLLSNGLARVAYLYDDYNHTKDYQLSEEEARIKKLNIHSIEGYVNEDEYGGFNMKSNNQNLFQGILPHTAEDVIKVMEKVRITDIFNISFGE